MTDSMLDLAEALPAVGLSQTQTPPQMPAGITQEIQEWMQKMLEVEVARRVTEATKREREGRMRAHQAAERAEEEEEAEYRGLWERQITINSETRKNDGGGEKRDHKRLRSALDSPPTFNGDQTKFRNFMEHLSLHFEEDPAYFGDEKKKIAFVLSYMKEGMAASFTSEWLEEKVSVTSVLEWAQYQRWSIFEGRLKEAFKNNYKEEKARNRILQLKQGSKTVRDFFLEFDSLRRKAGYKDDSILITLLKKNMNYTLVDKLYVTGLPPNQYEEWRKLLLSFNQIWREREKEKKGYFGQTEKTGMRKEDSGGTRKAYSGTIYTGAGQPMEIDKARYRKEGLCFKCRVKEHIGKFCPTEGKNKIDLRAMIAALSKEERKALKLDF